jgi:hypothetical protein
MVTTGSVLEDHPAADECHRRMMDFIRHHVGPMLALHPVAFAGHGARAESRLGVRLAQRRVARGPLTVRVVMPQLS